MYILIYLFVYIYLNLEFAYVSRVASVTQVLLPIQPSQPLMLLAITMDMLPFLLAAMAPTSMYVICVIYYI